MKNNWDDITVITKENDNKKTVLAPEDLVSINKDTNTVDLLKDSDLMSTFMSKNNISATFTLSNDGIEKYLVEPKNISKETIVMKTNNIVKNNTESKIDNAHEEKIVKEEDPLLEWIIEVIWSDLVITWDLDKTISTQLWINTDGQQVPNQNQMKILTTNLNSFFLMDMFEGIYSSDKRQQNISKLADRINSISSSFWYPDHASSNLSSIKSTILTLKTKLENDWYISPSYITQMDKVSKRCDELSNPSYTDWESLESMLPGELKLK